MVYFSEFTIKLIKILKDVLENNENDAWKKAAHKVKGASANLGAESLAEICLKAEKSFKAKKLSKQKIFNDLKEQFEIVKVFIKADNQDISM